MKKLISLCIAVSFLTFPPLNAATTTEAHILTKFNIEKVASCSTANMQYICMQDEYSNLTMMTMDLASMYAKSLKTIFRPNSIKGPAQAPGNIKNISEPQLPKYGNYASFIGTSGNRRYLVSIDAEGKTMKTAVLPDTSFDGVNIYWDLLWFRLNANGQSFFGVARGTVKDKGKKGTCLALVVMDTDGQNPFFIGRPKWTGTKFEYSKDGPGQIISPIGMSRDTMKVFYKAKVGTTNSNGIYSCDYNGENFRLVATVPGKFTQTASTTKVWSLDLVTDNGKYLILNDNGLGHKGAVSIDASSGAILARLSSKVMATSNDGSLAFFKGSSGLGVGFIIGGEPQMIVKTTDAGYPAIGKLNNRSSDEPPVCCVTQSPFALVGRSETDVRGKGQLYYTVILSPPSPPSPKLVLEPPVIDLGIVSGEASATVGIRNPGQTAISGKMTVENGTECQPFSFDGKSSISFNEVGDVAVNFDPKCLEPGQTKEAQIKVTSTGGNAAVAIVATLDNPERAMGKIGFGRNETWIGTKEFTLKVPAFMENGSSYVPMDFIKEIIPCDFTWNADDKTAIVEYQETKIELNIDSTTCLIDDIEATLSKPPLLRDGMVFLPSGLLKETFACKMEFYSKTQSLVLDFPKPIWGRESIEIDGMPAMGEVFLNNQKVGMAPLTLRHLQPGKYWVKVQLDGYEDYESIVEVPPSPLKVFYFLQRIIPKTATFHIQSKPTGAYVYIDDRLIGASPQNLELEPGVHRLKVVMAGYPEYITDVVALKGEEVTVSADLETLKDRFGRFVTPKNIDIQLVLPKQKTATFDLTVSNESGLPQAYKLVCPRIPGKGFEGVYFQTLEGEVSELVTPSISPGEKLAYRLVVRADDFAAPGDIFEDKITINSTTLATWKTQVPFRFELTGTTVQPPSILFEAPERVRSGESFEVKVLVKGAFDLMACKFRFAYQNSRVSVFDVTEGDFMKADATTFFTWKEFTAGEISINGPVRVGKTGAEGDGLLFTITFKAIKDGELILDPANIELYDSDGERITPNQTNSLVVPIDKP